MKFRRRSMPLGAAFLLTLGACDRSQPPAEAPAPEAAPPAPSAAPEVAASDPVDVSIEARSGSDLTGSATFTEQGGGVAVSIEVANVAPGPKGAHIHQNGDCSAEDASSAGDHFNPGGHPHARPPDAPRHLGDLGNIEITQDGTGILETMVEGANLRAGDPNSFLDRAVIIHGRTDDGSQPSGNAGPRIGCGVITPQAQ
jgi:Cu-Zn family superoxide dismutase